MASFWDNLKARYQSGDVVVKLIYINVLVFLVQALFLFVCKLFGLNAGISLLWLKLPASFGALLLRPWSLFTYMFLHGGLTHLIFNMLWLYFFGRWFLRHFDARQLLTVYLLGGLMGGAFYILGFNFIPYYRNLVESSTLVGASAAVLALTLALACYRPDEELNLMFFGRIRMKWLAVVMIVIDILSLTGDNGGGSLAHLGGALLGAMYGLSARRSTFFQGWFSKSPKKSKARNTGRKSYHSGHNEQANITVDQEYRDMRKAEEDRLDKILDKIKTSGYDSLTKEEKTFLFESGKH